MEESISKPVVSVSSLFSKYEGMIKQEKKSRRTQRGDLLDQFLYQLNPSRIASGKYKPLTHAGISRIFSERKMTVEQVYQFYRDCQRAKNFSSYFWWALNPAKHEQVR